MCGWICCPSLCPCCRLLDDDEVMPEHQRWCVRVGITLVMLTTIVTVITAAFSYQARPRLLQFPNSKTNHHDDFIITPKVALDNDRANRNVTESRTKISVFAEHPFCAETGRKILSDGGSAVDAGIAMLFCQGVVEPHHSGLGGSFLMTIYLRETKQVVTLDARGTAPAGASATMFEENDEEKNITEIHKYRQGWLTVTIPGEALGLWEAHKRYGKLPWHTLVDPAIRLASFGFPVSHNLAYYCALYNDTLRNNDHLRKVFINPKTNDTYKVDEDIVNEDLAKVLMRIAASGVDYIYKGDTAVKVGDESVEKGGILSRTDFINYKVKWSHSLTHIFKDNSVNLYTLHVPPTPSCAIMIGMIINIVQEYGDTIGYDSNSTIFAASFYHRVVEAMKHTFARKSYFGDSSQISNKEIFKLLSLQWGATMRASISSTSTFLPDYYMQNVTTFASQSEDQGTTNVGAVAPNGDVIVASSSLNDPFGAGVVSDSLGFLLNNFMLSFAETKDGIPTDFDNANSAAPGKRPLSSMSPIIVLDKKDNFKLLMAASGGIRIPTSMAVTLMRYFWLHEDMSNAINQLRFHHQLVPNTILYEGPPREYYMEYLRTYGHELNVTDKDWPHIRTIVYENETLISVSDKHENL